jgi:serine/threonine protein kinase
MHNLGNPLFGSAAASFGYPPTAAASSRSSNLTAHREIQLQSPDWNGSNLESQRRRKYSKDYGIMYIQMQYCKTTMRGMIDETKLSIDAVWKSLRQILEALQYIHSRSVIHRDLKPAKYVHDIIK